MPRWKVPGRGRNGRARVSSGCEPPIVFSEIAAIGYCGVAVERNGEVDAYDYRSTSLHHPATIRYSLTEPLLVPEPLPDPVPLDVPERVDDDDPSEQPYTPKPRLIDSLRKSETSHSRAKYLLQSQPPYEKSMIKMSSNFSRQRSGNESRMYNQPLKKRNIDENAGT